MEHLTEIPNFPKGYYPESQFPESHFPESLFSRWNIIPNPYFPEGTLSRISICPKGNCPEFPLSRRDIFRIPLSRRDIVSNPHFPKHCSRGTIILHHRSFGNDLIIIVLRNDYFIIIVPLRTIFPSFSENNFHIRFFIGYGAAVLLILRKKIHGLRTGILSLRENGDSGYYPFGKMEIRDIISSGK